MYTSAHQHPPLRVRVPSGECCCYVAEDLETLCVTGVADRSHSDIGRIGRFRVSSSRLLPVCLRGALRRETCQTYVWTGDLITCAWRISPFLLNLMLIITSENYSKVLFSIKISTLPVDQCISDLETFFTIR